MTSLSEKVIKYATEISLLKTVCAKKIKCFVKYIAFSNFNRVFHEHTKLAKLATQVLLRENKKKSNTKMLPLVSIEPGTSAI